MIPSLQKESLRVHPGPARAAAWLGLCAVGAIAAVWAVQPSFAQEPVAESVGRGSPIDKTPIAEAPITDGDRAHWAFAPAVRPTLASVRDTAWGNCSIDSFILARLEKAGLEGAPQANRQVLLRRVTFDLIGLPPTPDDLAAFERDEAPDAYERVVDRLLASPAYGERWAQHWLDLARFAETDGYEHDKVRPEAWRYRDWVIAALNADLPYDEFVRQQLAADEGTGDRGLETQDSGKQSAIPTMFCLAGPDMPDINDQAERRHNRLNELTATVGAVFLGLQMGCAQCHDHKYDPLSQGDFYRLRAVFEPAVPPLKRDAPYLALAAQKIVEPARFWIRGDHRRPGVELPPAFPRIATPARSVSEEVPSESETPSPTLRVGVRSEFAEWLTQADNPLTSRVIANRLWQHHFGRGICETPSDFGLMSGAVTHPDLLDWLAVELRESGWEMKRLHRMIVGSAVYRQNADSESNSQSAGLYSCFPRRRLEGEAIRDAMLSAAGLLTNERGGPGVMPPLPPELVSTLLKDQWKTSPSKADHYKRSIYVFARRNLRYPIFEAFDRPDANASCPARNRSTTAPQSLTLLNSEFSLLAARHLAGRILARSADPAPQVAHLYELTLSRKPTANEALRMQDFLTAQGKQIAADARPRQQLALPPEFPENIDPAAAAALVDAALALLNSSEFLYVD
jgi:hypothetical protein